MKNLKILRIFPATLVCLLILTSWAPANNISKDVVKVGFIFNFLKFVEWPNDDTNDGSLQVCALGRTPLGGNLAMMQSRTVQGREIRVSQSSFLNELFGCHVLFIADSEKNRVKEILASVKEKTVLTVSDIPDFIIAGGMIGLNVVEDRIRFEINNAAAQHSNLHISSQLLNLALKVI
ncbi:YfiR family protein [Desulfonatronum thioautotrophicum]|uniref:YfiR family protein n=1 Tax=Desulfonatronum thioautotrophicum TaxID=617001 RepID=UPI0005EB3724|nr:YfiR family protein [Desulfonatronum thioautotrophicum]